MGLSERFQAAWRAFRAPAGRPQQPQPQADPRKPSQAPFVMRAAMAGALPGQWGSDHLREIQSYTDWTYVAVHTVAKQFAQASVSVKTRQQVRKGYGTAPDAADDDKSPDPRHPIVKLLAHPNPLTPGRLFRYQIGQQIRLTGGAIIWERRNGLNLPAELWVIPRGWLTWQQPTAEFPVGRWRVNPTYSGRWMSPWIGGAGFWGMSTWDLDVRATIRVGWTDPLYPGEYTSPLNACSRIIDTAEQTEKAVWSQLARGIHPGILLSIIDSAGMSAPPLDEPQRAALEAELDKWRGSDGFGKPIIGNNVGIQELGPDLGKIGAAEVRQQNRSFVNSVQGVPDAATGAINEANYSALAAGFNGWIELSIQPDLDLTSDAFTHRWRDLYGGEPEVCFDAKRFDDPTLDIKRATQILDAVKSGGATWNEWRTAMKLPKRADCDELVQPQQQPGADGMGGPASPAPGGDSLGLDLDPELGDDRTSGFKRPDLSAASGNRIPAHLLNGSHR